MASVLVRDGLSEASAPMRPVEPGRQRARAAAALIMAVTVGGGAVIAAQVPDALHWTAAELIASLVLTLVTFIAELFPLHLRYSTETETFSVSDVAWTAALVLAPSSTLLIAVAAGGLLSQVLRRLPARKVAFNTGQFVLAMGAAVGLFHLIPHPGPLHPATWAVAAAAMVLDFVVNEALVGTVISLVERQPLRSVLFNSLGPDVLLWLGNVTVGIIAAVMWTLAPAGVVVAAVPVVLSYLACAGWLHTLRERDRMEDLYRAGQVLLERLETEGDFRPFLELVGRMLDADATEIVITRSGMVQIHDASGTVSASPDLTPASTDPGPGAFHRPSDVPSHEATIGGPRDRVGSLAVYRRTPLSHAERALLEALAAQVYIKLRHSEVFARAIEREEELARIISSSSDGIFVVAEDGRVTSWSPAMERITGVEAGTALGRPVWSVLLVPPGEEEVWTRFGNPRYLLADGMDTGAFTRPDGGAGWVRFSRSVLRSHEGQPVGVVVVARDVSSDIQAEQAKTNFIAAISHELRTPLTPLKGYLSLLANGQMAVGTEEARESFGVMLRHAARLERLINDLLDASQIEMDQPVIRTEKLDLVQMIGEVVAEWEPEPGPPILFEPRSPRALVHGDRFRARQVLTNLVSNAIKHSPPDAPVRVATSVEDGTCVVSVTDRGAGIPAVEQDRIFERFYRVENSATQETGGVGLGLYIAKQLVESMAGRMWVSSQAGRGSTFSFSLPLVHGPHVAPPRASST